MIRLILTDNGLPETCLLRSPSAPVTIFDDGLRDLIADLWDTCYGNRGVGLAAPQIGVPLQVAVVDTLQSLSSNRRLVLINPKVVSTSGSQLGSEGCLSMPGLQWPITRPDYVRVEYQNIRGRRATITGRGLLARALLHETDHLAGVLCKSLALQTVAT